MSLFRNTDFKTSLLGVIAPLQDVLSYMVYRVDTNGAYAHEVLISISIGYQNGHVLETIQPDNRSVYPRSTNRDDDDRFGRERDRTLGLPAHAEKELLNTVKALAELVSSNLRDPDLYVWATFQDSEFGQTLVKNYVATANQYSRTTTQIVDSQKR